MRRAMAHRAASEQFLTRRISHTQGRTGVLIFVSLAERYARIIADEGIAAQVDQTEWQGAIDALTAQMRAGHVAEGFLAAISICGEVLARHARQPLSREKLMELARGREYEVFDRSLDVQISRLRKLIEPDVSKPRFIQTVWGLGYVFIPDGTKT
jgi:hypothetical protein